MIYWTWQNIPGEADGNMVTLELQFKYGLWKDVINQPCSILVLEGYGS